MSSFDQIEFGVFTLDETELDFSDLTNSDPLFLDLVEPQTQNDTFNGLSDQPPNSHLQVPAVFAPEPFAPQNLVTESNSNFANNVETSFVQPMTVFVGSSDFSNLNIEAPIDSPIYSNSAIEEAFGSSGIESEMNIEVQSQIRIPQIVLIDAKARFTTDGEIMSRKELDYGMLEIKLAQSVTKLKFSGDNGEQIIFAAEVLTKVNKQSNCLLQFDAEQKLLFCCIYNTALTVASPTNTVYGVEQLNMNQTLLVWFFSRKDNKVKKRQQQLEFQKAIDAAAQNFKRNDVLALIDCLEQFGYRCKDGNPRRAILDMADRLIQCVQQPRKNRKNTFPIFPTADSAKLKLKYLLMVIGINDKQLMKKLHRRSAGVLSPQQFTHLNNHVSELYQVC